MSSYDPGEPGTSRQVLSGQVQPPPAPRRLRGECRCDLSERLRPRRAPNPEIRSPKKWLYRIHRQAEWEAKAA